jgi:hypothetical protein
MFEDEAPRKKTKRIYQDTSPVDGSWKLLTRGSIALGNYWSVSKRKLVHIALLHLAAAIIAFRKAGAIYE